MSLSKDELLRPRFKVIAKWPSMRDFELNQIITLNEDFSPQYKMWSIEDCQGKRTYITKFFEDYPHLFERLDWWHERSDEQMPKYLRFIANKSKVVELVKLYNRDMVDIRHHDGKIIDCLDMELFLPATEEEYNAYNSQKQ